MQPKVIGTIGLIHGGKMINQLSNRNLKYLLIAKKNFVMQKKGKKMKNKDQ